MTKLVGNFVRADEFNVLNNQFIQLIFEHVSVKCLHLNTKAVNHIA